MRERSCLMNVIKKLEDKRWRLVMQPPNGLKIVDLFCGAGIGAVGFLLAGYEIIFAIDNKKYAVDNYNRNIPGNHAILGDVRHLNSSDIPKGDVYVGGFPCTPYSQGGNGKGVNDEKYGDLAYHFFRLVKESQPKAFIIENVNGMLHKKHKSFFDEFLTLFSDANYNVSWKLINTWDYGVPQLRKRVFIVGIHKLLQTTFIFPDPIPLKNRKTLFDAISDLPNPDKYPKEELDKIILNQKEYYNGGFSSRYVSRNRQKQWNEPSFTIVSQARQLPLYPEPPNYDIRKMDEYNIDPPRRFTVRECLRIQTVPDTFSFSDDTPLLKQYERCSGIPTLMAYKLGISLEKQLKESLEKQLKEKKQEL